MEAFFQWLATNSIAAIVLMIGFSILVLIFVVGFIQGRELSLWPPKIGPKILESAKKNIDCHREISDGLNTFQLIKSQWARDIKVDKDRIANADTIDWMGVSLRTTVYTLKDDIVTCLKSKKNNKKGEIRILMVDPESELPAKMAHFRRDSTKEKLEDDIRYTLHEELPKIVKRVNEEKPKLDVGFFLDHPPYRLLIVNRNDVESGYIRLRLTAANTANTITIVLTKKEEPEMFNFIVEQFEIFWRSRKEVHLPLSQTG